MDGAVVIRRLVLVSVVCGTLAVPVPASAIGDLSDGNEHVEISDPAFVVGDLWVDSNTAYAVAVRSQECWYPQEWYDDAVIVDDDGSMIGYDAESPYVDLVQTVDASRFAAISLYSPYSCVQNAFMARGDCSDGDRLAVLSTAAIRDVYRGVTLSIGDFDIHDIGGLYCLVIITRDSLYERLEDEERIPEPLRATFPQTRTLVGLENSVWYDVAEGVDPINGGFDLGIPTAGNDYFLDLDIWLAGVEIDINGDGYPEFRISCTDSAACTGSLDDPLYTFEYETRAFHNFTIRTLWAGIAVDEIGTVLNIEPGMMGNAFTFDWETVEVRSSLDG